MEEEGLKEPVTITMSVDETMYVFEAIMKQMDAYEDNGWRDTLGFVSLERVFNAILEAENNQNNR